MSGCEILGIDEALLVPYIRRDGSPTTEDDPQRLVTRADLRWDAYWTIGSVIVGALVGTFLIRWIWGPS